MRKLLVLLGIGAAAYSLRDERSRKRVMSWMRNMDVQQIIPSRFRKMSNRLMKNIG